MRLARGSSTDPRRSGDPTRPRRSVSGLSGVIPGSDASIPTTGARVRAPRPEAGHWTGTRPSERTFGHFGGSGTFLWVDPDRRLALAVLTDLEFGDWALEAWPKLSDDVVSELAQV